MLAEPGKGVRALRPVKMYCALDDAGALSCAWGNDPPRRIRGVDRASQLVTTYATVCALGADGRVGCLAANTPSDEAAIVELPFAVRRIAATEEGLVLEASDGQIHACILPSSASARPSSCRPTKLGVAGVDEHIDTGLFRCSVNRERSVTCIGKASEDDREERPIAVTGLSFRVRRLVEGGLGAFSTVPVVCAIGSAGELACFKGIASDLTAHARAVTLPARVRDVAVGPTRVRVVLEDGRVFEIPTSEQEGAKAFVPRERQSAEPADAIAQDECIRYRSGRLDCGTRE